MARHLKVILKKMTIGEANGIQSAKHKKKHGKMHTKRAVRKALEEHIEYLLFHSDSDSDLPDLSDLFPLKSSKKSIL